MDGKNSAIVLMASVLPQEKLIELLEESISEYKEASLLGKSEEDMQEEFTKIGFHCHLILLNLVSHNSVQGAVDTIERMEKISRATKMFEPDEN